MMSDSIGVYNMWKLECWKRGTYVSGMFTDTQSEAEEYWSCWMVSARTSGECTMYNPQGEVVKTSQLLQSY